MATQPAGKGKDNEECKPALVKAEERAAEAVKPEQPAKEQLIKEEAVKREEDCKEELVKDEPEQACSSAAEPCSPASPMHGGDKKEDSGAQPAAGPGSSSKKRSRNARQDTWGQGGAAKKASPAGGGKEGATGRGRGKGVAPGQSSLDTFFIKNPA